MSLDPQQTLSRRAFGALGLGAGALLAGLAPAARAQDGLPPDIVFSVVRNGTAIGTHRVLFRPAGERMMVQTRIDLAVKVAFITAFRFNHQADELWDDARVLSLKSQTNDNGEKLEVAGSAVANGFKVVGPDGPFVTRPNLFTSNALWHPEIVAQRSLINAQHGGEVGLTVRALGNEAVTVPWGQVTAARHHVITPHLAGDIWHDASGRWVKAIIDLKGETIHYVLTA